jgi:transposase
MSERSIATLKVLRKKAVYAVVHHGLTQKKSGELFGLSPTSMSKYVRLYKRHGEQSFSYEKRGVPLGTGSFLTFSQEEDLLQDILLFPPDELGLDTTLWTSKVVHEHLQRKYAINYSVRGIRKLMGRIGFSSQKPIKLALQRNPEKIKEWLETTYPKIKERAMREGARIYWGDEMGIHSTDNRGRTYGLVGQTPVIKKTGSRFKCNMLAAISPQGFMNWMVFEDNFTSQKFIQFLGRMIRKIKQKIFLVVDNHRVHHSKKVKAYVEKYKDRIQLFFLPPYCPDMNPQELVNQDVKANANNFRALKNLEDLTINVRSYLTQIQFDLFKIKNFFQKNEVAYAAW